MIVRGARSNFYRGSWQMKQMPSLRITGYYKGSSNQLSTSSAVGTDSMLAILNQGRHGTGFSGRGRLEGRHMGMEQEMSHPLGIMSQSKDSTKRNKDRLRLNQVFGLVRCPPA